MNLKPFLYIGMILTGIVIFISVLYYTEKETVKKHKCNNEFCDMVADEKFEGCHKCIERSFCRYVDSLHWLNPTMPFEDFQALVKKYSIPKHKITYSEDNLAEAQW